MTEPGGICRVVLTGQDLTLEEFVAVCRGGAEVVLSAQAMEAMRRSRALAEKIAQEALTIQNQAGRGILPEELAAFYRVLGALNQNFSSISITGGTYEERTDHS